MGGVILGLGTVSTRDGSICISSAALQGSPELALGNAYGSNIMNIALVLGITALISPIIIHSSIVKRDLPLLLGITILAAWQLRDGQLRQADSVLLLLGFLALFIFQIVVGLREGSNKKKSSDNTGNSKADTAGLSRGLASLSAARKGEHDMALGNIICSNIFNTLRVVGLAALIAPIQADPIILSRDVLAMGLLTVLLVVLSVLAFISKRQFGSISGSILLLFFIGYTVLLAKTFNL